MGSPMNLIARSPARRCAFHVCERSGVWSVTKNNAFYGDYLSREQALQAACFGARTVEAQGGSAQVLTMPGEVPVSREVVFSKA